MSDRRLDAAEDWGTVRRLFEEAVDLDERGRLAVLERARTESSASAARVERLLAVSDVDSAPLDRDVTELLEDGAPSEVDRDDADLSGTEVGGYALTERLSSGGMGDVYLAERAVGGARRRVAIKVLKRGLDTDALLRRFRREQETLAALHHEHIVAFLDAGALADGRPYLVMEHVEGVPITEAGRTLGIRGRVELLLAACSAVTYAHGHLVLHRDLKPSNILVTAEGTPKLLDFGIAAALQRDGIAVNTDGTRSTAPFTPRYASPEQLTGGALTVATDVHALGLTLYEMLTGVPARPEGEALLDAASTSPPPPSAAVTDGTVARQLRGDLDAVVLAAAHPDPARRYAGVGELAADMRRWLDGEPVSARRGSASEAATRFVRRHRLLAASTGVAVVVIVAALVGLWLGKSRAERDASRGWGAHAEARRATLFLESLLVSGAPAPFADAGIEARVTEELGDDAEAEALVRLALGHLALERDDEASAARHLERARAIMATTTVLGRYEAARAAWLLGRARVAAAEPGAAELLRESVRGFESLSRPAPESLFGARLSLAEVLAADPRTRDEAAKLVELLVRGSGEDSERWADVERVRALLEADR